MADHAREGEGRPLVGVLLVVLATLSFALGDVAVKHLAMLYPVSVVFAVRYLVNVGLLAVFLWPRIGPRLWQANRLGLVLLRALCLAGGSFAMALALRLMPVGEVVAILYLSPIAVMLLAVPLLGEKVRAAGWVGAAFGFLGVLMIVRPGGGLDPLGVLFAVINAGLATAYFLLTRLLSHTETTVSMLFHTAWVGALIFCLMSIPVIPRAIPPVADIGLMALLGGLSTTAHFLFTAAYREAPASQLAPINYLHLVWASGLGWLVFGHIPDAWALTGMVLVAGAGVMIALSSHAQNRKTKATLSAAVGPITPVVE